MIKKILLAIWRLLFPISHEEKLEDKSSDQNRIRETAEEKSERKTKEFDKNFSSDVGKPKKKDMIISLAGLEFLHLEEGFSKKTYDDGAGYKTIGFGIEARAYEEITGQELKDDTVIDLATAHDLVHKYFKLKGVYEDLNELDNMTQAKFDMMCSFLYNVGVGRLDYVHKTALDADLSDLINQDRWDEVYDVMKERFIYASGKVFDGLVRRREREIENMKLDTIVYFNDNRQYKQPKKSQA